MTGPAVKRPTQHRGCLAGRLLLVAVMAAVPVYLLDCDPLIDGHGYAGDETMTLTMARTASPTGAMSYGQNPNGTPWRWSVRFPLWKLAYGFAVARADPINRVEVGRLTSRALTLLGIEAWVFGSMYLLWGSMIAPPLASACALSLISALTLMSLEPLMFVASFARNDSLGFCLACLTFGAGACFFRKPSQVSTSCLLWLAAWLGFWGHFGALLFSLLLSVWLWLLIFVGRCRSNPFRFVRQSATGMAIAALIHALVYRGVYFGAATRASDASPVSTGTVVPTYSLGLLSNLLSGRAIAPGFSKWLEFSEILVVVTAWILVCLGGQLLTHSWQATHGLAVAARRLAAPISFVITLSLAAGALEATYDLHDVYRPITFVACLAAGLIALNDQLGTRSAPQHAWALVFLFLVFLGLKLTNTLGASSPGRFPGISYSWTGYQPFNHALGMHASSSQDGLPASAALTLANGARRAHLVQLQVYLRQQNLHALLTLDPMLLTLQQPGLDVFYFHSIEQPMWSGKDETEIATSVLIGRGVRFLAATRQGLNDYHRSLRDFRSCLASQWRKEDVVCRLGSAELTLKRVWTSDADDRRYVYGGDFSTPIRLYSIPHIILADP